MFCYNCGKELPENTEICPACGAQVGVSINNSVDENVDNHVNDKVPEEPAVPDGEFVEETVQDEEREVAPHAISSFVWSLVANETAIISVLGLVFSLIAFVKSLKGRRIANAAPERYRLKGLLTAAFIISILDMIASIIGPIALMSYFSFIKDMFDGSGPFSSSFV